MKLVGNPEFGENGGHGIVVGDIFEKTVTLDAERIKAFALAAGDHNPLHHDSELAKQSRFGGLIASGIHTAALILGMIASHVSECSPNVGLGYSVRLRRAVRAGETVTITARVISVTPKTSLRGHIAVINADMRNAAGETVVSVKAESLLAKYQQPADRSIGQGKVT